MDGDDSLWYIEPYTENLRFEYRVKEVLYQGRTKFQRVDLFDLYAFGKTLFLDGKLQSAQIDERVYHEALVHPALLSHRSPGRVLIAGGGEGATLREVLRHPTVEKAVMVDIDGELVEVCKEYMPEWSQGAFEDERSEIIIGDARKYVFDTDEKFDVVISDLTEPVEEGPSISLYTLEFLSRIYEILDEEGLYVAQAGSADPLYNKFVTGLYRTLREVFEHVSVYVTFIFSFQLLWAFVLASKKKSPLSIDLAELGNRMERRGLKELYFLNAEVMKGMFSLPNYLLRDLKRGEIFRDGKPFIWQA